MFLAERKKGSRGSFWRETCEFALQNLYANTQNLCTKIYFLSKVFFDNLPQINNSTIFYRARSNPIAETAVSQGTLIQPVHKLSFHRQFSRQTFRLFSISFSIFLFRLLTLKMGTKSCCCAALGAHATKA